MDFGAKLKYSVSAWRLSSQHFVTTPWRRYQAVPLFGKNEALLRAVINLVRLGALGSKRRSTLAVLDKDFVTRRNVMVSKRNMPRYKCGRNVCGIESSANSYSRMVSVVYSYKITISINTKKKNLSFLLLLLCEILPMPCPVKPSLLFIQPSCERADRFLVLYLGDVCCRAFQKPHLRLRLIKIIKPFLKRQL